MAVFDDPRFTPIERFLREVNPRGVSAPTAFERGTVRADPSTFGMMDTRNAAQDAAMTAFRAADRNMEILPEDQIGPTETLEDTIFQILMETIIGEQGIPEGVSAEAIAAIKGDFGPTTVPAELQEVAIDIAEAGGFDEWLAQQDLEGPPEELPTELEEEVDINADTTLKDEIGVDPDMPIDIPPPTLPPREGEEDGEGDGEGEQQESSQAGRDNSDYEFPDYGDIGRDYEPPLPRGQGGVIDDYRYEDPGFTVGIGVPFLGVGGSGGGGGNGGGGTAQQQGMFKDKLTPFMTSIGYTPVQLQQLIAPPKKDYIRELDGLFGRLLG